MEDKTLIPLGSIVKLRGNAKKAMIVATEKQHEQCIFRCAGNRNNGKLHPGCQHDNSNDENVF